MNEEQLRRIIKDEVRHFVQTGGKINRIAIRTGLSRHTIAKLAYGETKYPRMHTVLVVLLYFGYEISVRKSASNVTALRPVNVGAAPLETQR